MNKFVGGTSPYIANRKRIESVDFLRGMVMIIMTLDHVRDYFHYDAFLYSPTDLTRTTGFLFFTRYITHYCAPVFVFLAGISAYLYGMNKSKSELARYLLTRGIWLVFVEILIISLAWTFNPAYPAINLQVIWAIGVSMLVLSAMVYMNKRYVLVIAVLLIAGHNLLDDVHVPGTGMASFTWCLLHEPGDFVLGGLTIFVRYPVMPWIGTIALGYYFGSLYNPYFNSRKRQKLLFFIGFQAIILFFLLRIFNIYGDAAHWFPQRNFLFTTLSFLNVTKYPPSLLYILVTLGPAMVFLGLTEKPLNAFTRKVAVFGRVPFFYYVIHLYLIHLFAVGGAMLLGHNWSDMILSTRVNRVAALRGYGFHLSTVYMIWIALVLFQYPLCKWFDGYKRTHYSHKRWLTYF